MTSKVLKTNLMGLSIAALCCVLPACSHHKAVVAPVPPAPAPAAEAPTPAPEQTEGTLNVNKEPTVQTAQVPEAGVTTGELPADLAELNRAGYLTDAFFDTDKADLRGDARDALAADAAWLKAHPTVRVLIEGHCDERNTADYNLALGWRRANATKAYLVSLGVAETNLATISYGEERPFATCHNESCWSQNRRAHFVITAR
jgi:peptidoglycan-associated lipoprotein